MSKVIRNSGAEPRSWPRNTALVPVSLALGGARRGSEVDFGSATTMATTQRSGVPGAQPFARGARTAGSAVYSPFHPYFWKKIVNLKPLWGTPLDEPKETNSLSADLRARKRDLQTSVKQMLRGKIAVAVSARLFFGGEVAFKAGLWQEAETC